MPSEFGHSNLGRPARDKKQVEVILMEELIQIISNVGFPITVALYFMLRLDKVVKDNTEALIELKTIIKNK